MPSLLLSLADWQGGRKDHDLDWSSGAQQTDQPNKEDKEEGTVHVPSSIHSFPGQMSIQQLLHAK